MTNTTAISIFAFEFAKMYQENAGHRFDSCSSFRGRIIYHLADISMYLQIAFFAEVINKNLEFLLNSSM